MEEKSSAKYRIGVVGSGTMGSSLVELFALSGAVSSVSWVSRNLASVEVKKTELIQKWKRLNNRGKISAHSYESGRDKIRVCDAISDLQNQDVIVEAISENYEQKKRVFKQFRDIEESCGLFASNTSALSITGLSQVVSRSDIVVGLHFFNPAPIMELTEIVVGLETSKEAVDRASSLSEALGKNPVVVNEAPGFIVNRMLIPMINEAITIASEGVASKGDIDKAMMLGANHPIGPLKLADLIGLDVVLSIMKTLYEETNDSKYRAHWMLRKMVRAGHLGKKAGVGFYKY